MTARWASGVLLAGLLVSAVPACASQATSSASVSAAGNGYGSQSTVMLHAALRAVSRAGSTALGASREHAKNRTRLLSGTGRVSSGWS